MLDYHLHLWPHSERAGPPAVEQLAEYCEHAQAAGVTELAITEHLHRFRQFDGVRGFWLDDPDPRMHDPMQAYWDWHATADLDAYVATVLEAKAAGLPVVLGLEVDHVAGRMDEVSAVLSGYPFDVLVGAVHWIGAWGFDNTGDPVFGPEWTARKIDDVWRAYTEALEELAASGACDVLAHPDLCKVAGYRPAVPDEFYDRMAEAAATCGLAAEVSSAGWRKPAAEEYPAPPLLSRFHAAGVPVTTASDAHRLDHVADRAGDLRAIITNAGYTTLQAYRDRQPHAVPI